MSTVLRYGYRTCPNSPAWLDRPSTVTQGLLQRAHIVPGVAPLPRYNVTISHDHQLVWFRVAKVGTRSIFAALRDAGIALDYEQPFDVALPDRAFRSYTRVAFVRHPIDRFISAWQSTVIKGNHFQFPDAVHTKMQDFGTFLDWFEEQDPTTCDAHVRQQASLIPAAGIDLLGRMETFTEDLQRMLVLLGIEVPEVPHANKSPEATFPDVAPQHLQRIRDAYLPDFERFGYDANI